MRQVGAADLDAGHPVDVRRAGDRSVGTPVTSTGTGATGGSSPKADSRLMTTVAIGPGCGRGATGAARLRTVRRRRRPGRRARRPTRVSRRRSASGRPPVRLASSATSSDSGRLHRVVSATGDVSATTGPWASVAVGWVTSTAWTPSPPRTRPPTLRVRLRRLRPSRRARVVMVSSRSDCHRGRAHRAGRAVGARDPESWSLSTSFDPCGGSRGLGAPRRPGRLDVGRRRSRHRPTSPTRPRRRRAAPSAMPTPAVTIHSPRSSVFDVTDGTVTGRTDVADD